MGIKHPFTSTKVDGTDATKVRPSAWNTDHTIDGDVDFQGHSITNANVVTASGVTVTDEAYSQSAWDGNLSVPTKNAIRDKIETLGVGGSLPTDPGVDRILMWDDSASTAKWGALADFTTEAVPAAGDHLLLQRAGSDDISKVNWSNVATAASGHIIPLLAVDLRDYYPGGEAAYVHNEVQTPNITVAMQAAVNANAGKLTGIKIIRIPCPPTDFPSYTEDIDDYYGGSVSFDPEAINWDPRGTGNSGGWRLEFACRRVFLESTFQVLAGMTVEGVMHQAAGSVLQQPLPIPWFEPAAGMTSSFVNRPLFKLEQNSRLKSIKASGFQCEAVRLVNTSCITIEDCELAAGGVGFPGIHIISTFWVNIKNCLLTGSDAYTPLSRGFPCMKFDCVGGAPTLGVGLINCQNLLIYGKGIEIDAGACGTSGAYVFEDIVSEGGPSTSAIFEVAGPFFGMEVIRAQVADPGIFGFDPITGGNAYLNIIKFNDDAPRSVQLRTGNWSIDSTSAAVHRGLRLDSSQIGGAAEPALNPTYTRSWRRDTDGGYDGRLYCAPKGPQQVIGIVKDVIQDPALWPAYGIGGTKTLGIAAPDGSNNAARLFANQTFGGTSGFYCFVQSSMQHQVGEWYVAGCWVRIANGIATNHPAGHGTPGLLINHEPSFFPRRVGLNGDDFGNQYGIGSFDWRHFIIDNQWAWMCDAFKVTSINSTVPANTDIIHFIFNICLDQPTFGLPSTVGIDYFSPCLTYIPAYLGYSDHDIVNFARSTRGAWSSGAAAGETSMLPAQTLLVGKAGYTGGVKTNRIATPVAGTKTITSTGGPIGLLLPLTQTTSGTITATGSYHVVDTEAAAATDDLDVIGGGVDGQSLVLRAANSARTVVVKDGTGNLALEGDCSLDNAQDTITLLYAADLSTWVETSRSNNGA